jgi:raffinose/stachyose/melibiose transport system substrate-binding protein
MKEQVESGVCKDITEAIKGDFVDSFYPAGVQNFVIDGKSYGLPNDVGPIVFWYNKDLASKAGIDPTQIKTWDDFIAAVKKAKAAGLTPIAAGGADKWPLHFYPAMLMMRVLGKDDFNAMLKDTKEGLAGPGGLKAWQLYKELCDLKPFQDGYQSAKYPDAAGYFHDGKAVFHLMGNWDVGAGRDASATKKGLSDAQLGWFNFPTVDGGKGKADDIFASVDGWLVGKDAPKETIDFLKVLLGKETQEKLAAAGLFIPMVKGTADVIKVPYIRDLAQEAEKSGWIQIAMDQLLGPDTGRLFNDQAAAVAAGTATPEAAVKAIEDSWKQNQG